MIKYKVTSRELLDTYNDVKSKRLIISPYFQRNLVWRTVHKVDFIKTILLGYPFPQIFIAKGNIDIENMRTTSCIVDGQQRMNAISEFIEGSFNVDGVFYANLSNDQKEEFLKYQIPIIDLDIKNEDPQIIEIFKRLNRTFYSLSQIEKLSTEYAPSEFMLTAKFLVNTQQFFNNEDEDNTQLMQDPNIPPSFIEWTKGKKVLHFNKLIFESGIFSSYELTRQVELMYSLNILATLVGDYFNRNELTTQYLESYANEFPLKDDIVTKVEFAANKILKLKLSKKSYWLTKANSFTLLTLIAKHVTDTNEVADKEMKQRLEEFEVNLPEEYKLAAKEAVNNKRERLIRYGYLKAILFPGSEAKP
jgi:Protein of unknown function DUF262